VAGATRSIPGDRNASPAVPRRGASTGALLTVAGCLLAAFASPAPAGALPEEPVPIGHEPQFVFDLHVIDNHWPLKRNAETVRMRFHQPRKHPANPLLRGPGRGGYVYALRDSDGKFRMYYQASDPLGAEAEGAKTGTAYAESQDGLDWQVPDLGLFEWQGTRKNNLVWMGSQVRAAGTQILELPERDRRGYAYVMLTRSGAGLELVSSHDGIH